MRKNLFTKLCIALLISAMFSILILTSNVRAISTEESSVLDDAPEEEIIDKEETSYVEEKIMEYDAKTGITKEVDIEELRQMSTILRSKNENNSLSAESIEPSKEYKEYMSKYFSKGPNYSLLSSDTTNREIVGNTTILPYSAVCKLYYSDPSASSGLGRASGTLVAKNAVLTSAHCVFDQKNNNAKFENWVAHPAFNGAPYKDLTSGWSKVYYSSKWTSTHSYEYDWALCILEQSLGSVVGAVGLQSYETASEMKNIEVRTFRISW